MTQQQNSFIEKIAGLALEDFKTSRIFPSITIAQAILESGWGTSELAVNANNLFGMKCNLSGNTWESCWDGVSAYSKETKEEYEIGTQEIVQADFRKYPNIEDSVKDHSLYLIGAKNGSSLRYEGVQEAPSYKEQIQIIKDGGYATDSQYVAKICELVETYNLDTYDENEEESKLNIRQMLVSSSKYSIKCPYSMSPKYIVVHNTANDASANNEVSYMINNNNEVSFHIAVDDKEAVQGIPLNRNAWHAGDGGNGKGNRYGIGIEICYSKSGGTRFTNAEKNAAKLIAQMLKERGWGIDRVIRHYDCSGKYCPHRTMDLGWDRFLNMVKAEMGGSTSTSTELYRVRKSWDDSKSQIGAYSVLQNAINACKDGYKVYNSKGVQVYPQTSSTSGELYRVRKSWSDASSQIGAYSVLENAKNACKEGYTVYNSKGEAVYSKASSSYLVKVTTSALNIRKGPGTNYGTNGCIRDYGTYTIVETSGNWGKLKSGAGWICLDYTKRV